MGGVVVIGEGEKDEAPMLYNGEEVGNGEPPEVDVAVDPLEGTRLTALGQPNAIAVIAVAERGTMFFPGAAVYMDKIACGAEIASVVDIDASPAENVRGAARGEGRQARRDPVVVLDRERHEELIDELREVGAKVHLIRDGDVAPAIAAARPAAGHRPADGHRRHARGRHLRRRGQVPRRRAAGPALAARRRGAAGSSSTPGFDLDRVLTTDDLVAGENVFVAATGVTDGALLKGVRYTNGRRGHRLDRDALTLGHRPPRRGLARRREALRASRAASTSARR